MTARPADPNAFAAWSDESTCGVFDTSTQTWFETSQNNLYQQIQEVSFFSELGSKLPLIAKDYKTHYDCELFALGRDPTPKWNKKSYASFLEKLYRLNCVDNDRFPSPPPDGWISLEKSFEAIDDIVRTTIVVAYADAPDFLGERLLTAAKDSGISCYSRDHAKEKGYYAFHLYAKVTVPVASTLGARDYPDRQVPVEIQITTELQGALREITHRLYEQERLVGGLTGDWKKQFGSGRFRAAYMAHSLRFIEAMIVDLRDQTVKDTSSK